jgi:sensor domain CHASE-containing protein
MVQSRTRRSETHLDGTVVGVVRVDQLVVDVAHEDCGEDVGRVSVLDLREQIRGVPQSGASVPSYSQLPSVRVHRRT